MPVTTPDEVPMVAMVVILLLHVPPLAASLRVVVLPWHTLVIPVIAGGGGVTVTVPVIEHPVTGAV